MVTAGAVVVVVVSAWLLYAGQARAGGEAPTPVASADGGAGPIGLSKQQKSPYRLGYRAGYEAGWDQARKDCRARPPRTSDWTATPDADDYGKGYEVGFRVGYEASWQWYTGRPGSPRRPVAAARP